MSAEALPDPEGYDWTVEDSAAEEAAARYQGRFDQTMDAIGEASTPMTKEGEQRHLEALALVPEGHELLGPWNAELYDRGLRPHSFGETVILGPAYDDLGLLIEGHVYLAVRTPRS